MHAPSVMCSRKPMIHRYINCEKYKALPQIKVQSRQIHGRDDPFWQGISAASCAVVDGQTGKLLFGRKTSTKREMASLTKIMTCYTVLQLSKRWELNLKEIYVQVSPFAARMDGTRAELSAGDLLSLHDLLYGLMLPSGNDAAVCLAEFFGGLIYREKIEGKSCTIDLCTPSYCRFPIKHFVLKMNEFARILGLTHSNFANPHGLSNVYNKSTAYDIGRLAGHAMHITAFREIVGCKEYECTGYNYLGKKKTFVWQNTQKLLWKGYNGIKTGVTPTAGPCLCSSIEKNEKFLIVVLLNVKSMDARWDETGKIVDWCFKEIEKDSAKTRRGGGK